MKIDYQSVFDEIYAAQAMLAGIDWDVSVTDGVEEVMAENGTLTVGINASDAVLSINEELLPEKFTLYQNYPNPFNPTTTIQYEMPQNGNVNVSIYNIKGELVEKLVDGYKSTGKYSIQWNPKNISSGQYFYQISVDGFVQTKKMVLLK